MLATPSKHPLKASERQMSTPKRTPMTILTLKQPNTYTMRVKARINATSEPIWQIPNIAVRLELEYPPDRAPISRVYTIRSFDPCDSSVEIDVVLHDHNSPAMRWVNTVRPGHVVQALGPKAHFLPTLTDHFPVAMFADETAVAAVISILRNWRAGTTGHVFIETPEASVIEELPKVDGLVFHHLMRDAPTSLGYRSRLPAAARSLSDVSHYSVWAAGESDVMQTLRSYFLIECGLPRERVRVFSYWRAGLTSSELDKVRSLETE
jgi:NADPH-dependent ferric siderophore reductase